MNARWLLLGLQLVLLLAATRRVHAYPHFQLSSGSSQCSQCHVGPAGGGLLTEWGQEEFGDAIARGGDGRFLHGALELPSWLLLGGNLRFAALANDVGSSEGVEVAAFPMQLDLSLRISSGAWSIFGVVGGRGQVRGGGSAAPDNPASEVGSPSLGSYLISREHYVMWRPEPQGLYLRAGRFSAPYGLRLVDHTAYVRRHLGFNLLEETYNLGGGWSGDDWELHATAFSPDPLQEATRGDFGAAAMYERQLSASLMVGSSTRLAFGEHSARLQAGIHSKLWMESSQLLLQGEVNGVREQFDGDGDRWQLVVHAGAVLVATRGVYAGVGYQAFAQDLEVHSVARHAAEAWISYFPRAHFEMMLSSRAQWVGPMERAYLGMLQLHYAL